MKAAKQSIEKTIAMLQGKFGAFDYAFYRRMVVAGFIADGFKYVELEEVGDWLTAVHPKSKTWVNIDIYKPFSKLKDVKI